MAEVTRLIEAAAAGEAGAAAALLPVVYAELRALAAARLAAEKPGHTLVPTALVHEAYLRFVGPADPAWAGRGHFFAAAAEAMRRVLVDHARARCAGKRGGGRGRAALRDVAAPAALDPADLLDLDDALTALDAEDPGKAALVRLRFFAGLSEADAAACLGLSRATAARHWAYARAWLLDRLGGPL